MLTIGSLKEEVADNVPESLYKTANSYGQEF